MVNCWLNWIFFQKVLVFQHWWNINNLWICGIMRKCAITIGWDMNTNLYKGESNQAIWWELGHVNMMQTIPFFVQPQGTASATRWDGACGITWFFFIIIKAQELANTLGGEQTKAAPETEAHWYAIDSWQHFHKYNFLALDPWFKDNGILK